MTNYVLDTNMVSLFLRNNNLVLKRMQVVEARDEDDFLACPMVYYEVRRGLLKLDARKQLDRFERLFSSFDWQEFTRQDWQKAADLWVQRVAIGRPIEDADLLIAVFALNRDAVLVTNNTKDFEHLGVRLEDWTS